MKQSCLINTQENENREIACQARNGKALITHNS
jgi:hypothetical protein